jgi:hypothetical protein
VQCILYKLLALICFIHIVLIKFNHKLLNRHEIIGRTLADKFRKSELEFFIIDRKVLEEGNEILSEESLSPHSLQSKRVFTRKSRAIDSKGNYFLVGLIRDITEERQREQDKRDAKKRK